MILAELFNKLFPTGEQVYECTKVETKIEDALTRAVCMDMDLYPSQWVKKKEDYSGIYADVYYINTSADVKVILSGISNQNATINDIEVGAGNRKKLEETFNKRFAADVLEKLLDRIEKVQTITPEAVVEEVRPKLVDPFRQDAMETLSKHISALTAAAQRGKSLPPPPRQLIKPNSNIAPNPHENLWRGKRFSKLTPDEFKATLKYLKTDQMLTVPTDLISCFDKKAIK